MNEDYCVVIGGVNIDIGGKPDAPLIPGDSNPGKIFTSFGGVGRNIAHNMSLMGLKVKLITALGEDYYGNEMKKSCVANGIDITGYCSCPNDATSTYLYISDKNGDMNIAVSDMNIYNNITPQYLDSRMEEINNAKVVVIDTNIPTESIAYLAKKCKVPIFADPVSCTKAARLLPSLDKMYAISPNALETWILTGIKIESEVSLERAAKALLDLGIKNVFITLGEKGVYAANSERGIHLKNLPSKLVNATGAGDAMMAGFAYAYVNGRTLKETAQIGLAAAAIAIEGENTINEKMNIEWVLRRAVVD